MDNLSSSKEESVQRFQATIDSVKAMLTPGDMIEVYGGPGVSKEQYIKIHEENDAFWREHGPLKIGPPPGDVLTQGVASTSTITGVDKSYAIFTNDDPSSSRTVQGISAHMSGIAVGTSQNNFSAFLVNGMTNVSNYQFQSGQAYYSNGVAKHVWTDTSHGLVAQWFNLQYELYHEYIYDVTYMGSPGVWWMGVEDNGTGWFDYFIEYYGQGTKLVKGNGTSVFWENANTNSNWWHGFPVYVIAYHAREWNGSSYINWSKGHVVITYLSEGSYPNNGKISGSLVNDQTALWDLTLLLLAR